MIPNSAVLTTCAARLYSAAGPIGGAASFDTLDDLRVKKGIATAIGEERMAAMFPHFTTSNSRTVAIETVSRSAAAVLLRGLSEAAALKLVLDAGAQSLAWLDILPPVAVAAAVLREGSSLNSVDCAAVPRDTLALVLE